MRRAMRHRAPRELGTRHDVVDHAEPMGLLGRHELAGEQQLLGLARAPLPRVGEVLDTVDAHADDGIGELGVVGGEDDVGDPQQHQAAGDRLALGGGDQRLGQVAPPPAHLEVDLLLERHLPLLALAGEKPPWGDTRSNSRWLSRSRMSWPLEKCGPSACSTITLTSVRREASSKQRVELVRHPLVLGVAALRAVERDDGDARLAGVDHLVVDDRSSRSIVHRATGSGSPATLIDQPN